MLNAFHSGTTHSVFTTNPAGIYLLKVNKETLEQGVKYVQS